MGWFDFLRVKRKRRRKPNRRSGAHTAARRQLKTDIMALQSQVQVAGVTLQQHSAALLAHKGILEEHAGRFLRLEQLVERPVARLPALDLSPSPSVDVPATLSTGQKCNIESFSPQEKRLLQVFFQHPQMPLSYIDIGRALGKSPNTIKNQIHQIAIKADLFDKSIAFQAQRGHQAGEVP